MPYVFLSYAREDADYATRLETAIRDRGIEVWRDPQIPYGAEWLAAIETRLDQSVAVVLIMTPAAKESKWVTRELVYAEERELPIFPVLLAGGSWLQVADVQRVDVPDGSLPPPQFYTQLKEVADGSPAATPSSEAPSRGTTQRDAPLSGRAGLVRRLKQAMLDLPPRRVGEVGPRFLVRSKDRSSPLHTPMIRWAPGNDGFQATFFMGVPRGLLLKIHERLRERAWLVVEQSFPDLPPVPTYWFPGDEEAGTVDAVAGKVADFHIEVLERDPDVVVVERVETRDR